MKFDFDSLIDRRRGYSSKWAFPELNLTPDECAADPLPMWVADMDFKSPQPVIDALKAAAEDGMFGYARYTADYIDAVCGWQSRRFGWTIEPGWIVQTPGVVTAMNVAIQAFSRPGDGILVQMPVYGHFHTDPAMNGRHVVNAPLILDGDGYRFDPATFEAAISPRTRLFILSNPHNPTGNTWSEDELRAMGEICARHGILVVADEIHQDLVFDKTARHIPFANLGKAFADNCIVCTAPSKTFNIAGLQCSNIFVPNARLRAEFIAQLNRNGIATVNLLGMVACEAAYRHGEPWLEALLAYIRGNQEHFAAEIRRSVPRLKVFQTKALYLAWMDCRGLGMEQDELEKFMLTRAHLWFDRGLKFGPEGRGFLRVNLGCPRVLVDEAIARLKATLG